MNKGLHWKNGWWFLWTYNFFYDKKTRQKLNDSSFLKVVKLDLLRSSRDKFPGSGVECEYRVSTRYVVVLWSPFRNVEWTFTGMRSQRWNKPHMKQVLTTSVFRKNPSFPHRDVSSASTFSKVTFIARNLCLEDSTGHFSGD